MPVNLIFLLNQRPFLWKMEVLQVTLKTVESVVVLAKCYDLH